MSGRDEAFVRGNIRTAYAACHALVAGLDGVELDERRAELLRIAESELAYLREDLAPAREGRRRATG